jgi:hypothetical protein
MRNRMKKRRATRPAQRTKYRRSLFDWLVFAFYAKHSGRMREDDSGRPVAPRSAAAAYRLGVEEYGSNVTLDRRSIAAIKAAQDKRARRAAKLRALTERP